MNILISGLVNIESTLKIRKFPVEYYPIDYPFFGIKTGVAGVAYNLAKAFQVLGDKVNLISYIGNDEEGRRILRQITDDGINTEFIRTNLKETPASIILYDEEGRRQIYCDLKDIQEQDLRVCAVRKCIEDSDIIVACNTNFNRSFLKEAHQMGKMIATDVHVLSSIEDEYNRDFMQYADILFLSDEQLPCAPEAFLDQIKERFGCQIIVIGLGSKGAMLYDRARNQKYFLPAVKADRVVNTVGAGDSLFSGFLHFYGKNHDSVTALEKAQIFASVKIGFNGAALGFSGEEEIEKRYEVMRGNSNTSRYLI